MGNSIRLVLGAALALALISAPARAAEKPLCPGCPTATQLQKLMDAKGPPAAPQPAPSPAPVVQAPPPPAPPTAVISAPPGQTLDISAKPPAVVKNPDGSVSVSVGSIASQLWLWIITTFSVPIGGLVTSVLWKVLKNQNIQLSDAARARFQNIAVNAINSTAPLAEQMAGHGTVEIKNAMVAQAVTYVQRHGVDTMKQLGIDPTSPEAIEAIRARIETALADPATPTPAAITPAKNGNGSAGH